MSLRLTIDLDARTPAYEQIRDGIRARLVSGDIPAGARLPPVRELAMDLGVHHNTVAEAYRGLAEEGWLELRRGRGAQVLERRAIRPPGDGRDVREQLGRRLRELVAKGLADGVSKAAILRELAVIADALRGQGR